MQCRSHALIRRRNFRSLEAAFPAQRQPQRPITSYLRQIFRAGGSPWSPATQNPLVEALTPPPPEGAAGSSNAGSPAATRGLPSFALAQPQHVSDAVDCVRAQQSARAAELREYVHCHRWRDGGGISPAPSDPSGNPDEETQQQQRQQQLDELIRLFNAVEQPAHTLRQMCALLWLLSSDEAGATTATAAWKQAAATAFALPPLSDVSGLYQTELGRVVQSSTNPSTVCAARYLLRQLEDRTGERLLTRNAATTAAAASIVATAAAATSTGRDRQQINAIDEGAATEQPPSYQELSEALNDVERSLLTAKSKSPQTIAQMYNYIGLRTEQAKLRGYSSVVDQVFDTTASATVDEIRRLHTAVAAHLVPYLRQTVGILKIKSQNELELDSYLTNTGRAKPKAKPDSPERQRRLDAGAMLRLEQHVTLDGALQFAFRLLRDLLGVAIVPCDDGDGAALVWHADVRLYRVRDVLRDGDDPPLLGYLYLDAHQRGSGKQCARPVTLPIVPRGDGAPAAVCVSLAVPAPPWDTDPAVVTWDECEALLHELGHAVHFFLAHPPSQPPQQPEAGCLLGPQNMPLDISELLPKVRTSSDRAIAFVVVMVQSVPISLTLDSFHFSNLPRRSLWNCG